jgi:hypothetical protein
VGAAVLFDQRHRRVEQRAPEIAVMVTFVGHRQALSVSWGPVNGRRAN